MPDWIPLVTKRLAAQGDDRPSLEAVEEIAGHLDEVYRAAVASGDTPEQARQLVERELAGMDALARSVRRRSVAGPPARRFRLRKMVTGLGGDVHQAWRLIRDRRGASAVAAITLAAGLGVCTIVFSLFNAVLLTPLPYPNPDRLVLVWEADADAPANTNIVSAPVYEDWRRLTKTLSAIAIWENLTFNISAGPEPEQVFGIRASSSLFDVLKVAPAMGRTFSGEEELPGHAIAVISYRVWQSQFGGDPHVLGRTLRLNGAATEVVGVMPAGFEFPVRGTGVWVPIALTERDQERDSHSFYVAGRLRDDVPFETASAEFQTIGKTLAGLYQDNRAETSAIQRMSDFGLVRVRQILWALFGAVVLVLLIACVNVANLQLGLALTRRREFVMRMALGAGAGRLARQLLVESLALALLGGLAGLALAWIGVRGLDAVLGAQFLDFWFRGTVAVTIDGRAFIFAIIASAASAILFGFAPLAGLKRADLQRLLQSGSRGATRTALGARRVLVAVEVCLAIVVLCSAGLLVKSLQTLLRVSPGLDPVNVVTMRVSLPQADTYGRAERATFCADLARESAGRSAFSSLGAISHLPLSGANASRAFTIEGRPAPAPNEGPGANYRISCPGYFRTLAIPLVAGRDFSDDDRQQHQPVVIVNRVVAERYWPGESPLGRRLKIGSFTSSNPWLTIVGVAENVRHFGLESDPRREIFVPYGQSAWPVMTIVAKTASPATQAATAELREVIRRVDPDLPVASVRTMEQVVGRSVNWRESLMRLLGIFAGLGLLLAAVGVYSVLAYFVSQRTREIGVRVALGATRPSVVRLVLRQSALPIVAGLIAGVALSLWTSRWLSDLLFQVQPGDPLVVTVIAAMFGLVALAASWLPARRAASVDPLVALRDE
jgi:putative ABC transport system permease protein